MTYRIAPEYREHKTGGYRYRRVKKRGAFYGEIRQYHASGKTLYLAARLPNEQVRIEANAWALDRELDFYLASYKVDYIGIAVTKDFERRNIGPKKVAIYYLISVENYKRHRRDGWDYTGHLGAKRKGGSRQWLIDTMFMHEKCMLSEEELVDFMLAVPK